MHANHLHIRDLLIENGCSTFRICLPSSPLVDALDVSARPGKKLSVIMVFSRSHQSVFECLPHQQSQSGPPETLLDIEMHMSAPFGMARLFFPRSEQEPPGETLASRVIGIKAAIQFKN